MNESEILFGTHDLNVKVGTSHDIHEIKDGIERWVRLYVTRESNLEEYLKHIESCGFNMKEVLQYILKENNFFGRPAKFWAGVGD